MNDLFIDNITFGAVMFDLHDVNGQEKPLPGSGWCSIEGQESTRIQNIEELDKEVIWLSNLSKSVLWSTGTVKYNNIKASSYLSTKVGDLMKELNIRPSAVGVSISVATEIIAQIFFKVMLHAKNFYEIDDFKGKDLAEILCNKIVPKDRNISDNVDEAMSRSYLDIYKDNNYKYNYDKYIYAKLRKPRLSHLTSIFDTAMPRWDEDWELYGEKELPIQEQRIKYLFELDKPFVAKVEILSYKENAKVNYENIIGLGENAGDNGKIRIRNWVSNSELLFLSKVANLKITHAFVAGGYQKVSDLCELPYSGSLSDFSISLGLLSESLFNGLSQKSYNPKYKNKALVSPRAVWLRSADRYECFKSVLLLSSWDFKVVTYGSGAIELEIPKDNLSQLDKLIELAPHAGLIVPLNVLDRKTLLK